MVFFIRNCHPYKNVYNCCIICTCHACHGSTISCWLCSLPTYMPTFVSTTIVSWHNFMANSFIVYREAPNTSNKHNKANKQHSRQWLPSAAVPVLHPSPSLAGTYLTTAPQLLLYYYGCCRSFTAIVFPFWFLVPGHHTPRLNSSPFASELCVWVCGWQGVRASTVLAGNQLWYFLCVWLIRSRLLVLSVGLSGPSRPSLQA